MPFPFDDLAFLSSTRLLGDAWNLACIMRRTGKIDAEGHEKIRAAVKARLAANRLSNFS